MSKPYLSHAAFYREKKAQYPYECRCEFSPDVRKKMHTALDQNGIPFCSVVNVHGEGEMVFMFVTMNDRAIAMDEYEELTDGQMTK